MQLRSINQRLLFRFRQRLSLPLSLLSSSLSCVKVNAMDADPLVKTLRQAFVQTLSSNPVSFSLLPRKKGKRKREKTRCRWQRAFVFFFFHSPHSPFPLLHSPFPLLHPPFPLSSGKHQASRGVTQARRSRPWLRHRAAQCKEKKRERGRRKEPHLSPFARWTIFLDAQRRPLSLDLLLNPKKNSVHLHRRPRRAPPGRGRRVQEPRQVQVGSNC